MLIIFSCFEQHQIRTWLVTWLVSGECDLELEMVAARLGIVLRKNDFHWPFARRYLAGNWWRENCLRLDMPVWKWKEPSEDDKRRKHSQKRRKGSVERYVDEDDNKMSYLGKMGDRCQWNLSDLKCEYLFDVRRWNAFLFVSVMWCLEFKALKPI